MSASQEAHSYRVFLAEINGLRKVSALALARGSAGERLAHIFSIPAAEALYAARTSNGFHTVLLDGMATRLRGCPAGLSGRLAQVETFEAWLP